jgi:hypothetical protein
MTIDTREELIIALHKACEIEHGLLVQYLYSGFSIKKSSSEGLTPAQQRLSRLWQRDIFEIAREEMGHFAIACNLLAAIGAPAKFHRPSMPRKTDLYPFPFDLMPFGDEALHRFLVFELPRGFPPPPAPGADLSPQVAIAALDLKASRIAPDPLEYDLVGELYEKIAQGFQSIDEQDLFIGPPSAQTENNWSDSSLDIRSVTNRATALAAIEEIIKDGEGTPQNRETSHYQRFARTRQAYFDAGRFNAARPVARNPVTIDDPSVSGITTVIKNAETLALAKVFNASYGVMLLLLQHFFSLAPTSTDPADAEVVRRKALKQASQRIMSVAIRPLAEELTLAPLDDAAAPERAGPTFEIYSDVSMSPYPAAQWAILLERLEALVDECSAYTGSHKRVNEIGKTLQFMRSDLADVAVR